MSRVGRPFMSAACVLAVLAGPALAQQAPPGRLAPEAAAKAMRQGMSATTPGTSPAPSVSPATNAFRAADDQMMKAMNRPMSGNPDQDFVSGMLPHHQGAVAMAKVELRYGKDPQMRRLAQGIIAAQEKEIAEMRAWQSHPVQP